MNVSTHGGRRAGSGRKPRSTLQMEAERLRVQAALRSPRADELFDRARRGDSSAARALRSLFAAAERVGLLSSEHEEALRADLFWTRDADGPVDAPAPGLFAIVEAPAAASGEQRQ